MLAVLVGIHNIYPELLGSSVPSKAYKAVSFAKPPLVPLITSYHESNNFFPYTITLISISGLYNVLLTIKFTIGKSLNSSLIRLCIGLFVADKKARYAPGISF